MSNEKTGFEMFDNDSLAWMVWNWAQNPASEVESETNHPGLPAACRVEFAKREAQAGHKLIPKHLRREGKR